MSNTATLVQTVAGRMIRTDLPLDSLEAAMEIRGFELTGYNFNRHNRAELQGAPIFAGVLGPMWDGDRLRYEDQESYNRLSE